MANVEAERHPATWVAAASALGVVFGDIGTSPLYTLKTVLSMTGDHPAPETTLGVVSLIVWTLILVTSIKYVTVAMRVDNHGEGGILALMSLLGIKRGHRPAIVAIGLFGAALIYGDGAITPAISVLSAVEGLNIATPAVQPWVLPVSVAILVALFAVQPVGTERIGKAFGPIMVLWFAVIAVLGLWGISRHPAVLAAVSPHYAALYLLHGGAGSFLVLGGVFLCVTGAEALYADMGHFGARPIRLAWSALVFPSLVLNYAGQAALVLEGEPASDNIFFHLCPSMLLIPLVVLSTVATVIASQAIISGAYSMTRQAIQLGWLPRLRITQTSAGEYGQIYVGAVNWLLMIATLGLCIGFGKSDNLAAAYGIAVSMTMLMTSVLLFIAMRDVWGWNLFQAVAVAGVFVIVDASFCAANLAKVAEGGWVPLVLGVLVYGVMFVWHTGAAAVARRLHESITPLDEFLEQIKAVPRVPGTAVFLTRAEAAAPPVMVWHLKHNRALHERLLVVTIVNLSIPWVNEDRLVLEKLAPRFWRATARFGFMERRDIPALLVDAHIGGCEVDLADVTYYVGHETVVPREDKQGLPRWVEMLFATMQRNALHVSDYFKLPPDGVVEIGRQVSI
ncbi:MAG TPA: KUP/HAK/KT family potassium transporter [Stellaceae bacterium]|nr:KUP/HAK/KT family potassium transporter [Stellaceae bacterium]